MNVHPASMYLRLAEGHDDVYEGPSRARRVVVLAAALILLAVSLIFAFGSPGSTELPWKVEDAAASPGQ